MDTPTDSPLGEDEALRLARDHWTAISEARKKVVEAEFRRRVESAPISELLAQDAAAAADEEPSEKFRELSGDDAWNLARHHWSAIADARHAMLAGDQLTRRITPRSEPGGFIWGALDEIRDVVFDLMYHDEGIRPDVRDVIEEAVNELVQVAYVERQKRRMSQAREGRLKVTFQEVVSRSVKSLRQASGLTQQAFADHMGQVGFTNWKRITVAEVESGKRQMSIEELAAVAILFDTPVAWLYSALDTDEVLVLNERVVLTAAQVQEVMDAIDMDASWLGIRLAPLVTGKIVCGETNGYVRPGDVEGGLWADVLEGEHGEMLLRPGVGYDR